MGDGAQRLPRRQRIAKRREFLLVYENGKKLYSRNLVLYAMANELPYDRLGVTVSRKIGKATVRNRVKRRLREIFRCNKRDATPALDLVINTRKAVAGLEFSELRDEVVAMLRRLGRSPARTE